MLLVVQFDKRTLHSRFLPIKFISFFSSRGTYQIACKQKPRSRVFHDHFCCFTGGGWCRGRGGEVKWWGEGVNGGGGDRFWGPGLMSARFMLLSSLILLMGNHSSFFKGLRNTVCGVSFTRIKFLLCSDEIDARKRESCSPSWVSLHDAC